MEPQLDEDAAERLKTRRALRQIVLQSVVGGLLLLGIGVWVHSSQERNREAEAQRVLNLKQTTYATYQAEIDQLYLKGVVVSTDGPYKTATVATDYATRATAVDALKSRILQEAGLSGSESTGQKAELLQRLDGASRNFLQQAQNMAGQINADTEKALYMACLSEGESVLTQDGFIRTTAALKGMGAIEELTAARRTGSDFGAAASRVFPLQKFNTQTGSRAG
ncbi:MAG TPA: hypothetical protein VF600_12580 [Abditibacteriaceae bacterium]|jgi:hypothetical protein